MRSTFLSLILLFSSLIADDSQDILNRLTSYQESLTTNDPAKVASYWTSDAEFIYPRTGETVNGNKEIAEALLKKMSEVPNTKILFKDLKVELTSSDHAIVIGYAQLDQNGKLGEKRARKIELVKENGQWLISRTSEINIANAPNVYERLKPLEWLIGSWNDDDDNVDIHFENKWDKNKNFIIQKFTSTIYGNDEIDGLQIIGWDPDQEKIRSWIFDTDGGYGGGYWTKSGNSWQLELNYTLSDGREATSLNLFTQKDADHYEFSSIQREVDGEVLPNIEPVLIAREKS